MGKLEGLITRIQRYSIQDGPGIRSTIFMKGCPLRCLWCANPEAILTYPEIGYHRERCVRDYACMEACSSQAISVGEGESFIRIHRELCRSCESQSCLEACKAKALEKMGYWITNEELMKQIEKDMIFYENSGGGVTFSGGEPTYQLEFVKCVLKTCQRKGIHTTLDTCGYVEWDQMEEIVPFLDLILFDLKEMDSEKHKKHTGVRNETILENLRRLSSRKAPSLQVRFPFIPDINDSKDNLEEMVKFLKSVGIEELDLMPYHRLGIAKYEMLGKPYHLRNTKSPSNSRLEETKKFFQARKVKCSII